MKKLILTSCGYTSFRTFDLGLGMPFVDGGYISGGEFNYINWYITPPSVPNIVCAQAQTHTDFNISNSTSITWTRTLAIPSNNTWQQYTQGNETPPGKDISFYFWGADQRATFKIKVSNNCGIVERNYEFKSKDCSGTPEDPCNLFIMSPNPASNIIKISVPNILPPCLPPLDPNLMSKNGTSAKNGKMITEIRLYNSMGNVVKKVGFNSLNKISFDISNIKDGVYYVEIWAGKYKENHPLIIKR